MSEPPRVEREGDHPVFVHVHDGKQVRRWLPLGTDGWEWTADGGLMPSIHCTTCGTHGFWVGGEHPYWRSC